MAESAIVSPADPPQAIDGLLPYVSPPPGPALEAILAEDVERLPYTDDQPLPDGRVQQGPLEYSRGALRLYLTAKRDDVAVDGDMFVYYIGRDECGEPARAVIAPDVFVVFGVPDDPKRSRYVLYDEPDANIRFVLEIASPSTRSRDHGRKKDIYAQLGVDEYFLFDPPTRRRPARVLGLTLDDGVYHAMPQSVLPNGHRGVKSEVLDLAAYCRDGELRWFDQAAGRDLADLRMSVQREREALQGAEKARQDAASARREASAAKARIAELEALLRDQSIRPPS